MDKPESEIEFVERMYNDPDTTWDMLERDFNRLFALARRGAEMQWRPIETAPKDGTKFYAVDADITLTAETLDGELVASWNHDRLRDFGIRPDFWMPLPPPPSGETE